MAPESCDTCLRWQTYRACPLSLPVLMEGQRCLHFWPIPRMVVLPPPVPQRKVYLVDILVEHEPKEPWAKTYINGDWKPDDEEPVG